MMGISQNFFLILRNNQNSERNSSMFSPSASGSIASWQGVPVFPIELAPCSLWPVDLVDHNFLAM